MSLGSAVENEQTPSVLSLNLVSGTSSANWLSDLKPLLGFKVNRSQRKVGDKL